MTYVTASHSKRDPVFVTGCCIVQITYLQRQNRQHHRFETFIFMKMPRTRFCDVCDVSASYVGFMCIDHRRNAILEQRGRGRERKREERKTKMNMNFCGLDQRNMFETESEMDILLPKSAHNFHCGACVKDVVLQEDDDDIETYLNIEKQLSPVSTASSSNEKEMAATTNHDMMNTTTNNNASTNNNNNSNRIKKPDAQSALDNIQQTMEDEITYRDSKSILVSDVVNVNDLYVNDDEDGDECEEGREDEELDKNNLRDDGATTRRDPISATNDDTTRNTPLSFVGENSNNNNSIKYPYSIVQTSSPCLLNPLDLSQWSETREGIELMHRRPELLCPILDITTASPSQETLLRRLEQGFHVRPADTSTIFNEDVTKTTMSNTSLISIYLHPDRSRICFGPTDMVDPVMRTSLSPRFHTRRSWYTNGVSFLPNSRTIKDFHHPMEIMVTDILRLEIGGQNTTSFSIITCTNESGIIINHSFEATCVIDREVVVSTLLLLLDQLHHSNHLENEDEQEILENDNGTFDWIEGTDGGTMDKPIPCSPSLDEPIEIHNILSSEEPIIHCSLSVETERIQNSYHYGTNNSRQPPSTYNKLTMSVETDEEESGDVIHLEDISITDSNVSRVVGNWSRRTSSSLCLIQQKSMSASEEVEDIVRLDCKASASSTQVFGGNSNSTVTNNITQGVWCSGDTCALALNDIAETCTGIFALKQNESICSPTLGVEQRVAVEEFIATALGTSTEVYSYLTEGGDIWSSKASIPVSDAKEGKIHRNRATILNAQAARLRVLRNEMTFATVLKQSKEKMQFVQTVQSFDDAYNRAGTKKLRAATEAANRLHTSPLLQSIVNNMKIHDAQGNTKVDDDVNINVVYYDSDPEDSRPHNTDKGPRRIVQAKRDLCSSGDKTYDVTMTSQSPPSSRTLVGLEDVITPMKISKKLDEDTIVEIVQVRIFRLESF